MLLVLLIGSFTLLLAKPNWINNPNDSKYFGAIGITKDKTLRSVAIVEARAELLESLKVTLSSESTIKTSLSSEDNYKKDFSREITQKADGIINNSYLKDSFIDKDGYLYVWVVIENKNNILNGK